MKTDPVTTVERMQRCMSALYKPRNQSDIYTVVSGLVFIPKFRLYIGTVCTTYVGLTVTGSVFMPIFRLYLGQLGWLILATMSYHYDWLKGTVAQEKLLN